MNYQMLSALTILSTLLLFSAEGSGSEPSADAAAKPISLHPDNPHYFLFRGKPTVLITSAEHYGAVINLEFDFLTYLNKLRDDGLNLTRVFTGAYREPAYDND